MNILYSDIRQQVIAMQKLLWNMSEGVQIQNSDSLFCSPFPFQLASIAYDIHTHDKYRMFMQNAKR
jgi:hypothetical protein